MKRIGLDVGSTTLKCVVTDENGRLCGMVSLCDLANREETAYDATDALAQISSNISVRD